MQGQIGSLRQPASAVFSESMLSRYFFVAGGDKEIRTPDLLIANETLYQLSYTPQADAMRLRTTSTAALCPVVGSWGGS